jgi:hypothetical protein
VVAYLQSLIEGGKSTYEATNKVSKGACSNQYNLEHKVVVSKRHHDVAIALLDKLQKGLGLARMIPLPPNIVEKNNVNAQVCIWVEHCPFFRLGFEPFWARQIASCKHVYHVWCAHGHFSLSIKCIDILCGEDMHESWWVATSIQNPRNELSFPQFQQIPKISNWQGIHIFLTCNFCAYFCFVFQLYKV